MNVERLEYLITLLENVEKNSRPFDMSAWASIDDDAQVSPCGTVCCALGTAALDPKCMQDGLALEVEYLNEEEDQMERFLLTSNEAWNRLAELISDGISFDFSPKCQGRREFTAGVVYYDINEDQADYLFAPGSYPGYNIITPSDVIKHIRDVLAGWSYPVAYDNDDDDDQAAPTEGFV